jgi:hypothetical protein
MQRVPSQSPLVSMTRFSGRAVPRLAPRSAPRLFFLVRLPLMLREVFWNSNLHLKILGGVTKAIKLIALQQMILSVTVDDFSLAWPTQTVSTFFSTHSLPPCMHANTARCTNPTSLWSLQLQVDPRKSS